MVDFKWVSSQIKIILTLRRKTSAHRTPKTLEGASSNAFQEILWLQYTEISAAGFRDKKIYVSSIKVIPFYF